MKVKTLIVGLGNPGRKYDKTRHNVGFMVLDRLCEVEFKLEKKFSAKICAKNAENDSGQARMTDNDVIFMKPQTFMNLSGEAVRTFADYYKVESKDVWVIHDDADIPFEEIRIKEGGSSAGHKGVESIIQQLGTQDFIRFRVGVKNDMLENIETEDFVLQRFSKDEEGRLTKIIDLCANEVKEILASGDRSPKTLKIQ